jgi:hypothetical protein
MSSPRSRSAVYVVLPDWVKPARPDVAAFFSALALAGLEGGYIRLRAADQRALLGCVPFGACAMKSDGSSLTLCRSVCFGTDWETCTLTAAELAKAVSDKVSCRPGFYSAAK